MKTIFQTAVDYVIDREGEQYTDHPLDAGGPTKFGITQRTLSRWRGQPATAEDVRKLTRGEAEKIYFELYWIQPNIYSLPGTWLSVAVFDQYVNRGTAAIRDMQRCLNVTADGIIGPQTLAAAGQSHRLDACESLTREFIYECQMSYVRIVERNASQIVFLRGWIKRTQELLALDGLI